MRYPDRAAVIDERGAFSYAELEQRTSRLANGLRKRVKRGTRIGILCRNHHGPVETMVAAAKLGVDVVLLNTGLSGQQLADVITQQQVGVLVLDAEFRAQLPELPDEVDQVLAWTDGTTRRDTLEHLIATSSPRRPAKPRRHARMIVLTSGTTGTPKGARRPDPPSLSPAASILSRLPLTSGERMLVCAP
ncbi:AMP-binding protein [Saccharopolyspora sp. NPDC002686]|uniref:AMP-binding protein n=1 Tax=Saccharopolyspora sp. NPDC002686 TaxID=3154541 RepID=UPI00331C6263